MIDLIRRRVWPFLGFSNIATRSRDHRRFIAGPILDHFNARPRPRELGGYPWCSGCLSSTSWSHLPCPAGGRAGAAPERPAVKAAA